MEADRTTAVRHGLADTAVSSDLVGTQLTEEGKVSGRGEHASDPQILGKCPNHPSGGWASGIPLLEMQTGWGFSQESLNNTSGVCLVSPRLPIATKKY